MVILSRVNCRHLKSSLILTFFLSFFSLAAPDSLQNLSSPTRNQTLAPCSGSTESWPLDHQGIPWLFFLKHCKLLFFLKNRLYFLEQFQVCSRIDEPPLTGHRHWKSMVSIRVPSWCWTFCRLGQVYDDIYPPLWDRTKWFHCLKIHLLVSLPPLPPHQSLIFLLSAWFWPLQNAVVGLIQCVSLCRLASFT